MVQSADIGLIGSCFLEVDQVSFSSVSQCLCISSGKTACSLVAAINVKLHC
jgi:hypothetical protein